MESAVESSNRKRKGKHDKPKPWDDESIDHWKIEKFDPSWNQGGMLEVSSFSTLFPQYREKYLQEIWPLVRQALHQNGISCELNLVEGSMTVSTTLKTRDPYIIIKSRDLLKLLSRSVPLSQAIKILDDEMQCDIIKIGCLVRNKERFIRRRQRLLGSNSSTLKAIEILTKCYVLIQGNTVAAMGSFKGLKLVRRIVEECMQNKKHPIYNVKDLMVTRELERIPELANENWDRLRPHYEKRNVKRKKVKKSKEKKPYTPFPPAQQPSKEDIQIESGEYFLSEKSKSRKKWVERQEKQSQKVDLNKSKREAAFIPPQEQTKLNSNPTEDDKSDITTMTRSIRQKALGTKRVTEYDAEPSSYIANARGSYLTRTPASKVF